nr:hypothetical protein [Tanacetum cinerariifolium]
MAIPNEPIPQGTGSGGSPRCQDTILRDRPTQTSFERLSKQSHEPSVLRVNTLVNGEDKIQGRYRHDMEFDYNLDTVKKDVNTAEPVSTGGAAVTTDSVAVSTLSPTRNIRVSTVANITMAETLVCIRKSMVREASGLPEISHSRWQPKTKAQQRTYMSNYVKNIEGYTLKQLRGYSFDEIKTLFETTMRRVNTFDSIESKVDKVVPELAVRSSKRNVEEELDQESSKKQKTGESLELAEEPRDKEADKLS